MPNIFELVTAQAIAAYFNDRFANTTGYLGAALFPAKKQLGLDLSWFKGSKGVPVMLRPSAFDAVARVRDRIGITKIETSMPFFRERMLINEKERQEINKLKAASQEFVGPLLDKIYADSADLINGAEVVAEYMRMKLLSSGEITLTADGEALDYDYAFDGTHKETIQAAAHKWSATATADPVTDIETWRDTIEDDTGVRPTVAVCTKKTFNYLVNNTAIRDDLKQTLINSNPILTAKMVQTYIAEKIGLQILVNNKKYRNTLTGSPAQFFPDEVFTLIPDGNLGNTYYGTTPEESDLMSGGTDAQVSIVNTGVAVTTLKVPHPVNVQTIVSQICLPSFEQIDQCFIATVHS